MKKLHCYFKLRLMIATVFRKNRIFWLRAGGYDVQYSTIIEGSALLDKLYPNGIHIGANTLIAGGSIILSHDHCKRVGDNQPYLLDTYIGNNCFIAVNAIVLSYVKIGDEVIVGGGSVVTKDFPPNSIAGGNPAMVLRTGIRMNSFAAIENWSIENGWTT